MPGENQPFFQWEKERPLLNPQFVDGAGPGPAAASDLELSLIWLDGFGQYADQPEAEVFWTPSAIEWTFEAAVDAWFLATAIAPENIARATTGIEIGDEVTVGVTVVVDAGTFELRLGAQVVVAGITESGNFVATITSTAVNPDVVIEGAAGAVGSVEQAVVGQANLYARFRAANAGPITVA